MKYKNYIKKISTRFEDRFNEIDPEYNFDQGNEFEITLATILNELLPEKFGICRGFVTTMDSKVAGDDIIIYDRMSAPLLKPQIGYDFVRKENVPVEAVYAYIEAKNTIELTDKTKGTSFSKAISQTRSVKKMPRMEDKTWTDNIPGNDISNRMFTAIFARGARSKGKLIEDPYTIKKLLRQYDTGKAGPDLVVIGSDLVILPMFKDLPNNKLIYESPYCIDGRSEHFMWVSKGLAYGTGLASILYVLQMIHLERVPWEMVIDEVVQMANKESEKRRKRN